MLEPSIQKASDAIGRGLRNTLCTRNLCNPKEPRLVQRNANSGSGEGHVDLRLMSLKFFYGSGFGFQAVMRPVIYAIVAACVTNDTTKSDN